MNRKKNVSTALLLALGLAAANAQQLNPEQGRPLAEVLAELQARGLRIVYSTAVVREEPGVVRIDTAD